MILHDSYLDNSLFDNLSNREKAVLTSNASLIKFDQEEMFVKSDSLLLSVYYIYSGVVKLKDNNNKLFQLLGAEDNIGLLYLFNHDPIYFSAFGIKGTEVIQFEKNVFKKFVSTNSKFLVDVYNKSAGNSIALTRNMLSYKDHKINGALANFLLHFDEKDCLHSLTQKEISEILGYSRENVCKCMNEFIREGIIEYQDESVKLLNVEALQTFKQFG
ncbi:MAG: Crp/Fnr family transcriptional regulator [Kaistella sp.]